MNKMSEISEKLFGQACPLTEDPIRSVETILSDRIIAQEPANKAILDAFTAWNLDREMKENEVKPLVLAFTGPTGVGKTETALSIGDALFRKRDRLQSGRSVPRGLLVRGVRIISLKIVRESMYHSLVYHYILKNYEYHLYYSPYRRMLRNT